MAFFGSPGLVTLTGLSIVTTAGLLMLMLQLRTHAPLVSHPRRLLWGIAVAFACSGVLAISFLLWMLLAPFTHVWYPVGPLVLIGNLANVICGVCVLLGLTTEGRIAAVLIAINQILWILFGILVFTHDF